MSQSGYTTDSQGTVIIQPAPPPAPPLPPDGAAVKIATSDGGSVSGRMVGTVAVRDKK